MFLKYIHIFKWKGVNLFGLCWNIPLTSSLGPSHTPIQTRTNAKQLNEVSATLIFAQVRVILKSKTFWSWTTIAIMTNDLTYYSKGNNGVLIKEMWPSMWGLFCICIFLSLCRYFLLIFVESQVQGNRKRSRFGWMSATVNIWAMFWGQGGGFRVSESLRSLLPMRLVTETSDDDILTNTCLAI